MAKHNGPEGLLQAFNILDTEIEQKPLDIAPLRLRAHLHQEHGDVPAAERDLMAAQCLQPTHTGVARSTADLHRSAGHPERSVQVLTAALKTSPGDPGLLFQQARALADSRQIPEALRDLGTVLESSPKYHQARLLRCRLLRKLDRFSESLEDAGVVLAAQSPGSKASPQLAGAAGRSWSHAYQRHRGRALHEQGKTLMAMKQYGDAILPLQELTTTQPGNCHALLDLARCLQNHGTLLVTICEAAPTAGSKLYVRHALSSLAVLGGEGGGGCVCVCVGEGGGGVG